MYSTLSVHFLPELTTPEELASSVVVVVDVLRATTTITAALAAGAAGVIPCSQIEQARNKSVELGRVAQRSVVLTGGSSGSADGGESDSTVHPNKNIPLLGGERGGLPIEGFDLGNSPNEYTPELVAGRTIVFTTTNGTQALLICGAAQRVLIGSFVNLSAVLKELTGEVPIHLLCAGTRGNVTKEDVLFAGALVDKLSQSTVDADAFNDQARIARDVWRESMGKHRPPDRRANQHLAEVLHDTQGGRNLINVGLQRDITDAAAIDRYNFVPEFDSKTWRITKPA
jgi:2-phosphosulfolactate phosphatase